MYLSFAPGFLKLELRDLDSRLILPRWYLSSDICCCLYDDDDIDQLAVLQKMSSSMSQSSRPTKRGPERQFRAD